MSKRSRLFSPQPAPVSSLTGSAGTEQTLPAPPLAVRRRGRVRAVVATMRPRQWVKNGLVLAAAGAAGALGRDDVPQRVLLACVAFCLLSSGIYAVNDVRDAAEDRLHPRKCRRPVAAGELGAGVAMALGLGLVAGGLALSALLGLLPLAVAVAYVALTVTYTLVWRRVIVIDILAIAGGFVLRALAGGVAAHVALSRWFVLVVSAGAVFVAAAKRLAELRRASRDGSSRRVVLTGYTPEVLIAGLGASVGIALTAYGVWAFELPLAHGIPWRPLTILPLAVCLLRYLALVLAGEGEAPEELVLSDPVLLLGGLTWIVLFGLSVHVSP